MANMTFSLDMDRVQSAVQAKIRPAVEAALAEVDLQAMISAELLQKPGRSSGSEMLHPAMIFARMAPAQSTIEAMVSNAIQEVAEEYVRKHVRAQRDSIEDALTGMLARSNNKLVKAFSGAITKAFEADWSFALSVEVSPTQQDRDDD